MMPLLSFFSACILTVAAVDTGCPPEVDGEAVGTCLLLGCSKQRGPTDCIHHKCYCQSGYCGYTMPATEEEAAWQACVARVPDSTCKVSHVCWSGGLRESFCMDGYCMCKYGYKLDDKGYCVLDEEEPQSLIARMQTGNYSQAEMKELLEIQRAQDRAVSLNILMGCMQLTALAAMFVGGAMFMYRKLSPMQAYSQVKREPLLAA